MWTIQFDRHLAVSLALALAAIATSAAADDATREIASGTVPSDPIAATLVPEDVAATSPRYPRAVIARPLTLPAGVAMLGADTAGNHDLSAMTGIPVAGFGITDELELQTAYTFATRELEGKGSVAIDAGYAVLRGAVGGKLEAIARVRGGYDLLAGDPTALLVGLHVQYNVTDVIAIISGVPGAQQVRIALADDAAMARPVDLSLPIGIGVQPTAKLYLQLDTRLAQLEIADSTNAVIGRDSTPVTLTAVFSALRGLDVQAAIGTDLSSSPGDALAFLIGARYYAGRL